MQTYVVRYYCTNCGRHSRKDVPVGQPAPRITRCPRCQTINARKII